MQSTAQHVSTETIYWLPGDGRLWQRSVYVGNRALAFEAGDYMGTDPAIEAMQRGIAQAQPIERGNIGRPLPATDAWRAIRWLQGLPKLDA